jgi:hypothetical protein
MLATRSLTEEQVKAGMMVSLPAETSKGLGKIEIDEVKLRVQLSREASDTAGSALMACAEHLYAIKEIVKKKGWTALCDSGTLGMGSKQAQMLALCHERLFVTGAVPSNAVANVSVTTLYLMASADDKKRGEMVAALVEAGGSGFTEKEARAIKNKGKARKAVFMKHWNEDTELEIRKKIEPMEKEGVVSELLKASKQLNKEKLEKQQFRIHAEEMAKALKEAGLKVPAKPEIQVEPVSA